MKCSYPTPGAGPPSDGRCLLCKAPGCGPGHIFGACAHPRIQGMVINRHNAAIHILYRAVAAGAKGSMLCPVMDAGISTPPPTPVLGSRLPAWLLPDACVPAMWDTHDPPRPIPTAHARAKFPCLCPACLMPEPACALLLELTWGPDSPNQ